MIWLTADDVAERLGVCKSTALSLMHQMPHSAIGGTVRPRIRVSEESLDAWMMKRQTGTIQTKQTGTGCNKKMKRR